MNRYNPVEKFFDSLLRKGYKLNWDSLTRNEGLTEVFFEEYLNVMDQEMWMMDKWGNMILNPSVSKEFIQKYRNDWKGCLNVVEEGNKYSSRYYDEEYFEENREYFEDFDNSEILSKNLYLSERYIRERIDRGNNIDWYFIALNSNISDDFFYDYFDEILDYLDRYEAIRILSKRMIFSEEFIEKRMEEFEDMEMGLVLQSEGMMRKYIEKIHHENSWDDCCRFSLMTPSFFKELEREGRDVDYDAYCFNKNITFEFALEIISKKSRGVNWKGLLKNPSFTEGELQELLKLCPPEHFHWIGKNENLSEEFFEKLISENDFHLDKKFWNNISENRSLSMDFFTRALEKNFPINLMKFAENSFMRKEKFFSSTNLKPAKIMR